MLKINSFQHLGIPVTDLKFRKINLYFFLTGKTDANILPFWDLTEKDWSLTRFYSLILLIY